MALLPYWITVQSACPTLRKDTVKGCDELYDGVWVGVGTVGAVLVALGVDVWLGMGRLEISEHPAKTTAEIISNTTNKLFNFFNR